MSNLSTTTINVMAIPYCPLVLEYRAHGLPKWKLTLQLKPEPAIIFTGTEPTRDEILECLRYHPSLPILVIDIIEVITGAEIARRAK